MVILGAHARFLNDWDKPLKFQCDGSRESISHIYSEHDNKKEDRRWDLDCSSLPGMSSSARSRETCHWTGYVNNWDDPFNYNCPNNGYITGMSSYHDNKKEDRRWQFRCCRVTCYHTQDCLSKWANDWDERMDFRVPASYVLTGVYSYHSNKKEDRLYQYRYCRLKKSC